MVEENGTEMGKVDPKKTGNPAQVGMKVMFAVAFIEPDRGALVGLLDARRKKFLVMPSADMPIGDVGKLCRYDNAKHEYQPTIYEKQAVAQMDRVLMQRSIKSCGTTEYAAVLMPFLVKE